MAITDTQKVAAHYQTYRPRWRLKDSEELLIRKQLKAGYTVEDMKLAIDALFRDGFCQGQNDRNKKYNRLGLAIDDKHIDDRIEEEADRLELDAARAQSQQEERNKEESRQLYKPRPGNSARLFREAMREN